MYELAFLHRHSCIQNMSAGPIQNPAIAVFFSKITTTNLILLYLWMMSWEAVISYTFIIIRPNSFQAILESDSVCINNMLWQIVPILQYPLTEKFTPDIDRVLRHKQFHGVPSQCVIWLMGINYWKKSWQSINVLHVLQYFERFDQVTALPSFLEGCELTLPVIARRSCFAYYLGHMTIFVPRRSTISKHSMLEIRHGLNTIMYGFTYVLHNVMKLDQLSAAFLEVSSNHSHQ